MAKKTKRQILEGKLDKEFSIYIRLRDRITGDLGKCITCDHTAEWRAFDNGHFQSRKHKSIRWHENNANMQCKGCNNWGCGEQYKHSLAIDLKFGEGTADKMVREAQKAVKWELWELEDAIEDYKNKIQLELKKLPTTLKI